MEQIKWPTTSVWFDETIELFSCIEDGDTPVSIAKKVRDGNLFGDMKESTAKRIWGTINARWVIPKSRLMNTLKWQVKGL